ncbi:LARP4 [Candida oxycetoniae]|uniref:LARP4 n=1 Tax=Candida oxycetoniae TaxID=497107 RepID=A0AAI9WW44_9ASCO|nr:LARP4 [Candida oxycetoniae]KAI3402830.2 LARP4 [Candida oxycetoniae]
MSNVKRLIPAPPPKTNAWTINTLVLSDKPKTKENDIDIRAATPSSNNISSSSPPPPPPPPPPSASASTPPLPPPSPPLQTSSLELQQVSPLSSPPSPSPPPPPPPLLLQLQPPPPSSSSSSSRRLNKQEMLITVGKNLKIKKPNFPKPKEIKGGSGHFRYKCVDGSPPSTRIWSLNSSPMMALESSSSLTTSNLPTPLLIPSANSPYFSQTSQSPPIFPIPTPMIVYGLPRISYPSINNEVSSASQNLKRETKKANIKRQLEYYFSTENLCKDTYLRSLFDKSDGKVEVNKLMAFNRLKILTQNGKYVDLLVEAAQEIPCLYVYEDASYLRLKNWEQWVVSG